MFGTLDKLKQQLRIDLSDTSEDTLLTSYLTAATTAIINYCNIVDEDDPLLGEDAEIPEDLQIGTIILAKILYEENYLKSSVKIADFSENYINPFQSGGIDSQLPAVVKSLVGYYRRRI